MNGEFTAVVVSLSGGALFANLFSVVLLIGETLLWTFIFPANAGK